MTKLTIVGILFKLENKFLSKSWLVLSYLTSGAIILLDKIEFKMSPVDEVSRTLKILVDYIKLGS